MNAPLGMRSLEPDCVSLMKRYAEDVVAGDRARIRAAILEGLALNNVMGALDRVCPDSDPTLTDEDRANAGLPLAGEEG